MAIGEIILHIGMHKTGTTSIQRTFDGYDDGDIRYADLKVRHHRKPNHGLAIETCFSSDIESIPHYKTQGFSTAALTAYRQQFRTRLEQELILPRARLIFSGEAIPRLDTADLQALRRRLMEATDTVRILAYIRAPESFSTAMFQQNCRNAGLRKAGRIPLPEYRRKFEKFMRVFGRESIDFVLYDRVRLTNRSSVDDFARRVGVTQIPPIADANISLSDDATRCLYMLCFHPGIDFNRLDNRLALSRVRATLGRDMQGPAFRLPPGVVGAQMDPADLTWIEDVTNFDLGGPLKVTDIELHQTLHCLSDTGLTQLSGLLDASGVRPDSVATVPEMLLALFQAHHKGMPLRAALKRTRNEAPALLSKILSRVIARK